MFTPLKSFDERHGQEGPIGRRIGLGIMMGKFSSVKEAFSLVLSPPPVRGIGQAGGFKMQVEDRTGLSTPQQLEAAVTALSMDARKDPRLTAICSAPSTPTFRSSTPTSIV